MHAALLYSAPERSSSSYNSHVRQLLIGKTGFEFLPALSLVNVRRKDAVAMTALIRAIAK